MRARSLLLLTIILAACASSGVQPSASTSPAEMERVVRRFYELRERTLDQRGTEQDVAALIALLTDDAAYEHPRAGVTMTRAQAAGGIAAHLAEGRNATITIHNIVLGADVATVELTTRYDVPETRTTRGISIVEFRAGRIRRIAEY